MSSTHFISRELVRGLKGLAFIKMLMFIQKIIRSNKIYLRLDPDRDKQGPTGTCSTVEFYLPIHSVTRL
jgi:hypothetical protein